jgi:hypothetical protein
MHPQFVSVLDLDHRRPAARPFGAITHRGRSAYQLVRSHWPQIANVWYEFTRSPERMRDKNV